MSKRSQKLHTVRDSHLRTTIIDTDLMENLGIDNHLIRALLNAYGSNFHARGDATRQLKSPIRKPLDKNSDGNNPASFSNAESSWTGVPLRNETDNECCERAYCACIFMKSRPKKLIFLDKTRKEAFTN